MAFTCTFWIGQRPRSISQTGGNVRTCDLIPIITTEFDFRSKSSTVHFRNKSVLRFCWNRAKNGWKNFQVFQIIIFHFKHPNFFSFYRFQFFVIKKKIFTWAFRSRIAPNAFVFANSMRISHDFITFQAFISDRGTEKIFVNRTNSRMNRQRKDRRAICRKFSNKSRSGSWCFLKLNIQLPCRTSGRLRRNRIGSKFKQWMQIISAVENLKF